MKKVLAHARENQDNYNKQLQEYLQIPSISTLPEHKSDVGRAAEWLKSELTRIGLENAGIYPTDDNPMVYAEWLGAGLSAPTILLYGHYDCQPVDPIDEWERDPFSAVIDDGKMWARGASDNKGQHFAHMKAFESMLAVEGKLPVNVKVLLEGEEEIASPNIEPFLTANRRLLAADSGVISDGAMIRDGQPSLDYGLRGVVALEIHVRGPGRDLHSGSYGGTVLNPIQALTEIIASLHDENGTITIPGFYNRVREILPEERELLGAVPYPESQWLDETGAPIPWGEREFTLLERIGARPTLELNGIWGGFQGEGTKTVIPSKAGAKISMRIVPDQDPGEISRLVTNHIKRIAPRQVEVEVFETGSCWPALMPVDSAEIEAASSALESTWGVKPVFSRGGGSLPVVAAFQRLLNAPFVLMPFGLDDNRHSPNEHIRLDYFHKGVETAIRYYSNLGKSL